MVAHQKAKLINSSELQPRLRYSTRMRNTIAPCWPGGYDLVLSPLWRVFDSQSGEWYLFKVSVFIYCTVFLFA